VAPEGVVILGMHRSGTSLITRLVSLLGLAVCRDEDLLVGRKANPRGHWESKPLLDFDDRLLDELGGTWFCPPLLGVKETSRMLDRHAAEALARLQDTHPESPWVWKDPRTCVLLPFWSAVLAQRAAYVLVVRHPFEVSDSLADREGYSPRLSLALWERYTRQAMLGAAGRPMMVCTYDGVLADPLGWSERLAAFLGELGLSMSGSDEAAVGAFAMDGLRHSSRSWTDLKPGRTISHEQVALAGLASELTMQKAYVPPVLPAETPETEAIFGEIRRHLSQPGGGLRRVPSLPAHLLSSTASRTDAEDAARPPVSLVLAHSGAGAEAAAATVAASLPPGSEVLVVGDEVEQAGDWSRVGEVSLRQIASGQPATEAEALALGVRAARGRIVLLTAGGLQRCEQWYEPFERALAARKVVGVGPVMRFDSRPERRHFGRAFVDQDLAARFVVGDYAKGPVPAALLFAAHCAYNRKVLSAAGGVDGGFSSAEAAIAELSVRLWRMGFRCCIVPEVEVWGEDAQEDDPDEDPERLYDRMRIAALHFDEDRLRAFTDRVSGMGSYEQAAERLAASDVERRRATIAAVCAFPIDRYFESFPPST
jgi:hypothetical protein